MNEAFRPLLVRLLLGVLAFAVAGYAIAAAFGPRGIPALAEKREQKWQLQKETADLRSEIEYRKKRIEKLERSRQALELEIRTRWNQQREDETTYLIPSAEDDPVDQPALQNTRP